MTPISIHRNANGISGILIGFSMGVFKKNYLMIPYMYILGFSKSNATETNCG